MRKKWYIVQTYSGLEHSIKESIESKVETFGVGHLVGKILIPEEIKLEGASVSPEKHVLLDGSKIKVKNNEDIYKTQVVAVEPEIHAKHSGIVREIKNYRIVLIETIDKKYTKTYFIPESAKVETGIKSGTRIKQGFPLAKGGEYYSEIDGRIVASLKRKRLVVNNDDGGENVYILYPETMSAKRLKKGSAISANQLLCGEKEIYSKVDGRTEIKEFPGRTEIRVFKINRIRLYPGYIFVEAVLNEETRGIIRGTPNVVNFVNVGGQPVELKKKEIRALLRLSGIEDIEPEKSKQEVKVEFDFEEGEMIRINSGPFEDFVGKITNLDSEKMEVKVIVSIFGRETPVILNISEIEKIV
jgi:transcriptional antiterminator NusG